MISAEKKAKMENVFHKTVERAIQYFVDHAEEVVGDIDLRDLVCHFYIECDVDDGRVTLSGGSPHLLEPGDDTKPLRRFVDSTIMDRAAPREVALDALAMHLLADKLKERIDERIRKTAEEKSPFDEIIKAFREQKQEETEH